MVASGDDGGFTTTFLYVAFNKHLDLYNILHKNSISSFGTVSSFAHV